MKTHYTAPYPSFPSIILKEPTARYLLWLFFSKEHGLTLTESDLDEIIHEVLRYVGTDEYKAEYPPR